MRGDVGDQDGICDSVGRVDDAHRFWSEWGVDGLRNRRCGGNRARRGAGEEVVRAGGGKRSRGTSTVAAGRVGRRGWKVLEEGVLLDGEVESGRIGLRSLNLGGWRSLERGDRQTDSA